MDISSNINFFDATEVFTVPTYIWGLGMLDVIVHGGLCPGGAFRAEKILNLIKNGRIKPGKIFN